MAGVEKIKEKILLDAEEKVREIDNNASDQASKILDDAKKLAVHKAKTISEKASYDASDKKRIVNSMAELEMRKNVLAAKQEVIQNIFQVAIERLNSMEASKYEAIMTEMILQTVKLGDEHIIVSKTSTEKLSSSFVERINEMLIKKGYKGNIKLSEEEGSAYGGFIIRSGGIEINNSFESILKMNRDDLEPKIAELLF